jgi:hypothetical protein
MTGMEAWCSNAGSTSGKIGFLELMQGVRGFDVFDTSDVLYIGA